MNRSFLPFIVGAISLLMMSAAVGQATPQASTEMLMKIRIVVDSNELVTNLEDTTAAREFADMLPLDITLEDYHATEKVMTLPSRLSTHDAPEGIDPEIGDVTYFATWSNLALFYRDFGYAKELVRLGRIEGSTAALEAKGALPTRIERLGVAK